MKKLDVGNSLKEHRKSRGLTQVKLSCETNISQQNISRWEKNTHIPDVISCLILAKFYGITIEELIGED